jgi:alpha-L-fucosidase
VKSLRAIGAWMHDNGAAIYGTTASPFDTLPWGRCTQKSTRQGGTVLYLHVFDWPKDGQLVVPGLKNKVYSASLLAGGAPLSIAAENGLTISLPAQAPNQIATVVALTIEGAPDITKH